MSRISDVMRELSSIGAVDRPTKKKPPIRFSPPQIEKTLSENTAEESLDESPDETEDGPASASSELESLDLDGIGIDTSGFTLNDYPEDESPLEEIEDYGDEEDDDGDSEDADEYVENVVGPARTETPVRNGTPTPNGRALLSESIEPAKGSSPENLHEMLIGVLDKLSMLDAMVTDTQKDVLDIVAKLRSRN